MADDTTEAVGRYNDRLEEMAAAIRSMKLPAPLPRPAQREKALPSRSRAMICPSCGHDDQWSWIEDAVKEWRLEEVREGVAIFQGNYGTWDESDGGRLLCRNCWNEFDLPEGMDMDWGS